MDRGHPTPLVSVVIPAFNAEDFIERAIVSVLSQTYSQIELVVVDDGSTDRTSHVAASVVDPRMRSVTQSNRGVATARNRGMAETSGQLIAFLDADDLWDPKKLEKQVAAIATQPACVAIGCFMRYQSLAGRLLGVTGQTVGPDEMGMIGRGELMPFPLSSILFDRPAVDRVSGFDESLPNAEDLDLLARITEVGTISCLAEPLGAYGIHRKSASAQNLRAQRMTARFVRERQRRRAQSDDLTWAAFEAAYRPTWTQRYGDTVQASYRRTAEFAADEQWIRALAAGAMTAMLGPRYALRRLKRQRGFGNPGTTP